MADVDSLKSQIDTQERQEALEAEMNMRSGPLAPSVGKKEENTDEHRSAFLKYVRGQSLEVTEKRSLMTKTDTAGHYLVPDSFMKKIIAALEDLNVMRKMATTITTSSDTNIPMLVSRGTASWVDENGSFVESDDSFGLKTVGAHKLGRIIKVSEELLTDSVFDLETYIVDSFAKSIADAEESAFVSGNGIKKPKGFLNDATVAATTAGATAITYDELIDLHYALARPYRRKAAWIVKDSTVKAVRKLKDANGQYIWQVGMGGEPDTLLGKPIHTCDDMPALAATNKAIAFGDFSYYWIADRQNAVFQRLNELYAANGQVGFRGYKRTEGMLMLAEAVQVLQQHA